MTTVIPIGFSDFSVEIAHSLYGRRSFVTGGVDNGANLDPSNIAQAVFDSFTIPLMLGRLDSNATVMSATVRMGTDGSPLIGVSTSPPEAGTLSQSTVAANSAVLVNKRTALGGRKNRGRWFLPWFITESEVDEIGIITPASVASLQTALNACLVAFQAAPIDGLVILHDSESPPPHDPTPVVQLQASSLIGSQRRRLGR
jgi:hypothetical protein